LNFAQTTSAQTRRTTHFEVSWYVSGAEVHMGLRPGPHIKMPGLEPRFGSNPDDQEPDQQGLALDCYCVHG